MSDHQNRAPAFAVRPTTGTSTSAGNVSGRSQEDERPFVSEQVVQVGTTCFFTRNSSTGASPPFLFFSLFFFPSFVPSFLTFLLGNSYMIRPREERGETLPSVRQNRAGCVLCGLISNCFPSEYFRYFQKKDFSTLASLILFSGNRQIPGLATGASGWLFSADD